MVDGFKIIPFICQYPIAVTSIALNGYNVDKILKLSKKKKKKTVDKFLNHGARVLESTLNYDSNLNFYYQSSEFYTMIDKFVCEGCIHSWNSVVYTVNRTIVGENCRNSFKNEGAKNGK
jgi:hypothetical protein